MRLRFRLAASLAVTTILSASLLTATASAAPTAAPSGPDVSSWQHPGGAAIDWVKVKGAGNAFAIIKATEGAAYTNPYFAGDTKGARSASLVVGAYAYVRPALPISTATTQAQYFAATLGNVAKVGTLPPILDLEESGGLAPGDLITWAQTFLETVRGLTGRTPIVYSYPYFWSSAMAGSTAFSRYPLWLAAYRTTAPTPLAGWPAWALWQYSATASVDGIPGAGAIDMSRFAGTKTQLDVVADGTFSSSWPVSAPSAPVGIAALARIRAATVSWRPADDGGRLPTSYVVTVSPGGATTTVSGTTTNVTLPGLTPGVGYTFTVAATNPAGTSTLSQASIAVVPGQLPSTPPGPLSVTAASGAVTVAWKPASGAPTSYQISRCSPAPCTPPGSAVATVAVPATSYVDRALTNGTSYVYTVAAANVWGSSGRTPLATATPVGPPPAPIGLTSKPSDASVTLGWTPPATTGGAPIARYVVTQDGRTVSTLPSTARFYQASGLVNGETHRFGVAVGSSLGTGPAARVTAAATSPLAPTRVTVTLSSPVLSGRPLTVTVHAVHADTGTGLVGLPVTVALSPRAGSVPAEQHLVTDASGAATATVWPAVTGTITASLPQSALTAASGVSVLAQVRPRLPVALSSPITIRNQPVVLSGSTSSLLAGERLYEQRYDAGAWRTVASTLVDPVGRYRFVVTPTVAGSSPFRLWLRASRLHLAAPSRTVMLTAR